MLEQIPSLPTFADRFWIILLVWFFRGWQVEWSSSAPWWRRRRWPTCPNTSITSPSSPLLPSQWSSSWISVSAFFVSNLNRYLSEGIGFLCFLFIDLISSVIFGTNFGPNTRTQHFSHCICSRCWHEQELKLFLVNLLYFEPIIPQYVTFVVIAVFHM